MSEIPQDLSYTAEHEWVRREDDGMVTIGVTDHAQAVLGDLVFVELPEAGRHYAVGEGCAVVESVKAASDVFAPLNGEVTAVNDALADAPEKVNSDPYGEGWLFRLRPDASGSIAGLLDSAAYTKLLAEEG